MKPLRWMNVNTHTHTHTQTHTHTHTHIYKHTLTAYVFQYHEEPWHSGEGRSFTDKNFVNKNVILFT